MVAYSFRPFFSYQIENRIKRQTVRGQRKRHAHPGEPVQLYQSMRTKLCRKLVSPDPICLSVVSIVITVNQLIEPLITSIELDGRFLCFDEIEAFAIADGFAPDEMWRAGIDDAAANARENMGRFWRDNHGEGRFEGVLIKWEMVA